MLPYIAYMDPMGYSFSCFKLFDIVLCRILFVTSTKNGAGPADDPDDPRTEESSSQRVLRSPGGCKCLIGPRLSDERSEKKVELPVECQWRFF